ncbi:MAG: hypothetical protein AB1611_04535 [bacterium]
MTKRFYLYGIGVWFILLILTVMFGAFREAFFIPYTGMNGTVARAILLPVAIAYTLIVTYLFLKRAKGYTQKDTVILGLMWLVLTIGFEFLFGHYIMGHPWEALLADYNILAGRTWGLFLVTIAVAPVIVHKHLIKRV